MPLTDHQLRHLNVVKQEIVDMGTMDQSKREMLLRNRGVRPVDFDRHMTKVKARVQQIIDSGVFPAELEDTAQIHDFLERDWDV